MPWRDQLGRVKFAGGREIIGATFRGVPFHVESAELGGGRRTVTHEYPLRDDQFVEDLGRKARAWPVDGYVVGPSYLALRDALISALEKSGPGELQHPHYGSLTVICVGFRVRESTSDGGVARFSIDFEETKARPDFPTATVAAEATVAAAADAAWATERAALMAKYSGSRMTATALISGEMLLAKQMKAQYGALAPFIQDVQQLAKLRQRVGDLVEQAYTLVRKPATLLSQVEAIATDIAAAPLTATLGVRALLTAYEINPTVPRPALGTATRVQERANYDALLQLMRSMVAILAARRVAVEVFETYDDAAAMRDAIGEKLDAQAEASDDDAYTALSQLRADLVRAVPGEGTDLPRLTRYTPAATVPSLVLAHRLYGDVSLEGDLVARNRAPLPGFIQGGTPLEVLSRA